MVKLKDGVIRLVLKSHQQLLRKTVLMHPFTPYQNIQRNSTKQTNRVKLDPIITAMYSENFLQKPHQRILDYAREHRMKKKLYLFDIEGNYIKRFLSLKFYANPSLLAQNAFLFL